MAQAVEPDRGAPGVSFEVERFEADGRDRVLLSGRWFGLRGRRFVRPTLTLGADGSRQRALADLDHKPWAAQDGELWEASFPYERNGGDPEKIELTVAPDITIALPVPGAGAAEQRIRARPRRDDLLDNLRGARRDGRPRPGSRGAADPRPAGRSATRWEEGREAQREAPRVPQAPPTVAQDGDSDGLALRLSQAQQEIERLKDELARHEGTRVEATSALSRRDAAVSRLTEALSARDQAARARDHAVRARDQALRERDAIASERDQALRERDRAIARAKKLAEAAATRAEQRAAAPAVPAHSRTAKPRGVVWAQRILAVSVLLIVVIALAITIHVL